MATPLTKRKTPNEFEQTSEHDALITRYSNQLVRVPSLPLVLNAIRHITSPRSL